jgi:hypothetical protein
MLLLCDVGQVEPHISPFGEVLISIQDRCTICVERTIGSKIILDAPKLLQDVDQVKVHFGPFGDCVNVDTR